MSEKLPPIGTGFGGLPFSDVLTLSKEADEAGFYSISGIESVRDAFVQLAAIAAVTRSVKLVTSIATWTRTPLTMSRAARDMNLLSEGRFVLGIGSMPAVWNRDHHDIPPERPVQRMREYVDIVRRLYACTPGTPISFQGQFYRVSEYNTRETPPPFPLNVLIGVSREGMAKAAGEFADGALLIWNHTLTSLKEKMLPALNEGARRSGRTIKDLHVHTSKAIIFTGDAAQEQQARDAWRRGHAHYMTIDYHQQLLRSHGFEEEVAAGIKAAAAGDSAGVLKAISDRMINEFAIVGTPEECRERVAQYSGLVNSFGVSTPMGVTRAEKIAVARRLIKVFASS